MPMRVNHNNNFNFSVCILLINCFLGISITYGQDYKEKLLDKTCSCIDTVYDYEELITFTEACASNTLSELMVNGTEQEKELLSAVSSVKEAFQFVFENIYFYCYQYRHVIIEEKIRIYYQYPKNPKANFFVIEGDDFFEQKDYENALKSYQSADGIEPNNIVVLDNIALCYRKLEKFKLSEKYYQKSLEVFPEGIYALQNLAVVYKLLEQFDEAEECYRLLMFYYPESPEGYFGLGSIQLYHAIYSEGLENMFIAYLIYKDLESVYIKDAEKLITQTYLQLKEEGKLALFQLIADKYDINIIDE